MYVNFDFVENNTRVKNITRFPDCKIKKFTNNFFLAFTDSYP